MLYMLYYAPASDLDGPHDSLAAPFLLLFDFSFTVPFFFLDVLLPPLFLSSDVITAIEFGPIIPIDSSSACYSRPMRKLL